MRPPRENGLRKDTKMIDQDYVPCTCFCHGQILRCKNCLGASCHTYETPASIKKAEEYAANLRKKVKDQLRNRVIPAE